MLAAVNRFNVVSFWNTLTGKLIHKKVLGEKDKIKDAHKYRYHKPEWVQYRDLANQFSTVS